MSTMTTSDFLPLLESALRQHRVAFSRAAAIAFVESAWPWIEEEPCPQFWGDRFMEYADVMAPETVTM